MLTKPQSGEDGGDIVAAMTFRIVRILVLALACAAFPAVAQVYKCAQGGKTVYQDNPCDGSIARSVAPQEPKSAESADRIPEVDVMVAQVVYAYVSCARNFPDLHAKHAMRYQAWRLKNSVAVSRLEAHPEFQADLKRRTDQSADDLQKQPGMRAQGHANCSAILAGAFDPRPADAAKPM
jgi:hypothetical protein